mmetsp:Transcript_75815/g.114180  ORF Transcript_75815/g.114180 Transcript_75815/m.114180 type:complete len:97 (-) Transcript_75815:154-444(-)
MIIDGKSIIITLLIVGLALTWGLKFIRKFALQIAQENHDAVVAMDQQEEQQRLKKERVADAAASAAFAKVEPILKVTTQAKPAPTPQPQEAPPETV